MDCNQLISLLPWGGRKRISIDEDEPTENMELRVEEQRRCPLQNGTNNEQGEYRFSLFTGVKGASCITRVLCSPDFASGDDMALKLYKIIFLGNVYALKEVLDDLSSKQINNLKIADEPLLHILCLRGDIEALTLVLARKVDVDMPNKEGATALHVATSVKWSEGVQTLLSYGANANVFPKLTNESLWPWQELPIHTAARNGDFSTAVVLLEEKPDLCATDSEGNTVLHLAALSHCWQLVSLLIENGEILNQISKANNKGNTPLHSLMKGDNLPEYKEDIFECANLLLQKGANVDACNIANKTALYLAARGDLPLVCKTLLGAGANPTIVARDGRNVLHAACHSGSHKSLSLLLASGRVSHLILMEDDIGFAPFHLAVSSCSIQCCELLIQYGDHLAKTDSLRRSRCSIILSNMPSATKLLQRVFDSNIEISNTNQDDSEYSIKMNFKCLISNPAEDIETSVISDFETPDAEALLKHPLIESFLYLKWHKIKGFFYIYVLLYFIFLNFHTFYIVKTYGMKTNWDEQQAMLTLVHTSHAVLLLVLAIPGMITVFANLRDFFKQWETYFKVIALSTATFIVFCHEDTFRYDVERCIASVSIFFTWVEFMMLLGRFPSLGIYILMFTRVAKSIVKFLLAFSSLLIAFTLAFGILLSDIEIYKHFPIGFVRILMMMLGEIEYSSIYEQTRNDSTEIMVVTHIFLVAFLFLIPVLMANLLIGLAVNDLPDLQMHGKIRRLVKEASYLESYERLLLFFKQSRCLPSCLVRLMSRKFSVLNEITIYPNQRKHKNKNDVYIPPEAIKEAMISGKKALDSDDPSNGDLETAFKSFYKEYMNDRTEFKKSIEKMNEIISSMKGGSDVPDSVMGSMRLKRSGISRKGF